MDAHTKALLAELDDCIEKSIGLYTQTRNLRYRVALTGFQSRPDDVFIVTYPKSGTTLMQMLLYQITTDGSMDIPHITAASPWFDLELGKNPNVFDDRLSPRLFKTHLSIDDLPSTGKIIYVIRNPKDVMLSYHHHLSSLDGVNDTLEEFAKRFLDGDVPWGSWFKHCRDNISQRDDARVLFLTFEELQEDRSTVIDRILEFLDIDMSSEGRQRVLDRTTLEYMKEHNAKFDPRLGLKGSAKSRSKFIRKGALGEGQSALTAESEKRMNSQLANCLAEVDLSESKGLTGYLNTAHSSPRAPIRISFTGKAGHRVFAGTKNIASGGLYLDAAFADVAAGDQLRLSLEITDPGLTIEVETRVVWVAPSDSRGVVVRFVDLAAETETTLLELAESNEFLLDATELISRIVE